LIKRYDHKREVVHITDNQFLSLTDLIKTETAVYMYQQVVLFYFLAVPIL
jgi:hypothetical protein